MDEKGFLIGLLKRARRIVPVRSWKRGDIRGALQDGSREFITLIAAVSAAGRRCPPGIIFSSESGDLLDTWLEDMHLDHEDERAYVAASVNGWSSEDLGLAWLIQFERDTRDGYASRLLILDGHGSHLTDKFIDYALEHRIWLAIFPPHATHILQPLDVSLFGPLAIAYDRNIDNVLIASGGIASITKRSFYGLFWPAWMAAFTDANIFSGWRRTGIRPWNPSLITDELRASLETSDSEDDITDVPHNSQELRAFVRTAKLETPSINQQSRLLNTIEHLAAERDIMQHDNEQLRTSLRTQSKKKSSYQHMGLPDADDPKYGTFFTPQRVKERRDALQAKKDEEAARKSARVAALALAKSKRLQVAEEKAQKQTDAAVARATRAAEKAAAKELAKAQREAKRTNAQTRKRKHSPIERKRSDDLIDPSLRTDVAAVPDGRNEEEAVTG